MRSNCERALQLDHSLSQKCHLCCQGVEFTVHDSDTSTFKWKSLDSEKSPSHGLGVRQFVKASAGGVTCDEITAGMYAPSYGAALQSRSFQVHIILTIRLSALSDGIRFVGTAEARTFVGSQTLQDSGSRLTPGPTSWATVNRNCRPCWKVNVPRSGFEEWLPTHNFEMRGCRVDGVFGSDAGMLGVRPEGDLIRLGMDEVKLLSSPPLDRQVFVR